MTRRANMDNNVNWGFNRAANKDGDCRCPLSDIIDW